MGDPPRKSRPETDQSVSTEVVGAYDALLADYRDAGQKCPEALANLDLDALLDTSRLERAIPLCEDFWYDIRAFSTTPLPWGLGLTEKEFWAMDDREWFARWRVWKSHQPDKPTKEAKSNAPRSGFPEARQAGAIDPSGQKPARTPSARKGPPRRVPDIEKSRERVSFCDRLASELASIYLDLKRHCTVKILRERHPTFTLWTLLSESQMKELADGEVLFVPRAYAETLTLQKFGITSRETLKYDRRKLRNAEKDAKREAKHP